MSLPGLLFTLHKSKSFQTDEKDDNRTMEEVVEKSMDALVKGDSNSQAYRRMSIESDWSKGESTINRNEAMKVLQKRASEYNIRKSMRKTKTKFKKPDFAIIQEVSDDDKIDENSQVPIARSISKNDPENLDERDV